MKFKSYHLRWGVVAIGCILILSGLMKGVFKIEINEKLDNWLMPTLFISAAILFVYMKRYEKQEAEEAKQEKDKQEMEAIENNQISEKKQPVKKKELE